MAYVWGIELDDDTPEAWELADILHDIRQDERLDESQRIKADLRRSSIEYECIPAKDENQASDGATEPHRGKETFRKAS